MGKTKSTEIQAVELNTKNLPKEIKDPGTGRKIKVSQDMVSALVGAERQITSGVEQIALGLHRIRNDKLYLLYELESMEEYLEHRFRFSRALGYRLLKFADVFGDSDHFAEIMQQPRKLLEIAANNDDLKKQLKDGEVTMPDGSTLTLKELTKSAALQMANELDIAKKELKASKKETRELREELDEKQKMVQHFESGMAEGEFKKLTEKKAIKAELFAIDAQAAEIIKTLDRIESQDPQIVRQVEATLAGLLAGASAVQNKWMHYILSTTPDSQN